VFDQDYVIKDKYKISNFCKAGAFGDVFYARHTEKNYEVAIKFVINYINLSKEYRVITVMKSKNGNMITR
jgi:hypothetical protein